MYVDSFIYLVSIVMWMHFKCPTTATHTLLSGSVVDGGQWRVVMLTLQYNPAGYSFVYPYKGMCSLNTWKGSLNQQTTTKKRRRGRHETRKSDVCWYCSCFFFLPLLLMLFAKLVIHSLTLQVRQKRAIQLVPVGFTICPGTLVSGLLEWGGLG